MNLAYHYVITLTFFFLLKNMRAGQEDPLERQGFDHVLESLDLFTLIDVRSIVHGVIGYRGTVARSGAGKK